MTVPGHLDAEALAAPVVPRPAATIMLLREGSRGPEVLLLRRNARTPFVPGAHVFPGGAVDPVELEDDASLDDVLAGASAADVAARLGVDRGARAFFLAAVRECLEEAAVVLARDRDDRLIDGSHPVFDDLDTTRAALETGARTLADVYRSHGLRVPLDDLAYVARWITPPFSPRRYDTRFFAAAMPEGQRARADGWEAVAAGWHRPADALSDWQAGGIELIEPTVASLELLASYRSVADAMAALHAGVRVEGADG